MILVLGASGRLGQMLRWAWAGQASVTWHMGRADGDLIDPSPKFQDQLHRAEVIVNLSGVTPAPDADLEKNIRCGTAPFELAPQARILTASSGAVYGLSEDPHHENEPLAPLSPYGKAKLRMEQAITTIAGARTHLILRIGNVAGADQLLGGLGRGQPHLHCFADGATPVRSYIGPRGLADAIAALCTASGSSGAVNVAAGPVSMGALLQAAGRNYVPEAAPDALPRHVELDRTRLSQLCPGLSLADCPDDIIAEWTAFKNAGKQSL